LRLPVGWLDSSLRYRSTSGKPGNDRGIRCVSLERWKSASMRRTAASLQALSLPAAAALLVFMGAKLSTRANGGKTPCVDRQRAWRANLG